ncbi:MAG: TonB-dependent receptor [Gammaproteobacteria bacterium]|nr:TonB-dependent receptor [Gammaproteobacteria bacterium]
MTRAIDQTVVRNTLRQRLTWLGLAPTLCLGLCGPAAAQNPGTTASVGDASETLQEVIVTAQFRQTRLQDTPIAITAVTAGMLEARSQTDITQVANQAPNVTLTSTASAFGPGVTAYIRGIGQNDTSFALEPGVGMYIDDVYYSTVLGTDFELLDLDRVEILRGPQGTLAGMNSIGGAVRLYSKKPSGDTDGFVEGTIGSLSRHDFKGAANFTLVDGELFARLTGLSKSRDGYVNRMDYACAHPGSNVPSSVINAGSDCKLGTYGGQNTQAMRAQLRWLPIEGLEVNLAGDITDDRSDLAPTVLRALPAGGYTFPNGAVVDSSFLPPASHPYTSYATFCASPATNARETQSFCVPASNYFKGKGASADIAWIGPGNLVAKSITSYREYDNGFGADADETPYDYQVLYNHFTHYQFSQELRLSGSALGNAIDWTTGGFYFHSTSVIGGRVDIPTSFDMTPHDPVVLKNESGFVHAVWHATSRINVTGGYRYTSESKDYTFYRRLATDQAVVPPSLVGIDGLHSRYQGSHSDYKASLDYHFTPAVMGYVQWSTGFRGGGVAPRPFFANQGVSFKPETLDAYEVGLKSDLFERSLRVNVSAFVNNYKDIILSPLSSYFNPNLPVDNNPGDVLYNPNTPPFFGTFPSAVPQNAGKARFKGVELEAEWHPTRGFSMDLSGSWIEFNFTQLAPGVESVAQGGTCISGCISLNDPWVYTPKWKVSTGAQYEFRLTNGAALTARVDLNYQDKMFTRTPITSASVVHAYTVSNARLMWHSPSDTWDAALEVTNLANRVYYTNALDLTSIGGVAVGSIAPPREWGFTLRHNF